MIARLRNRLSSAGLRKMVAEAVLLSTVVNGGAAGAGAPTRPADSVGSPAHWAGSDAAGQPLPGHAECGPLRDGKHVGIFYFVWLGAHGVGGPYDITELIGENATQPEWGPRGAFHHWGEPELGYYLSTDPYVYRRHASMLVDAGVDVAVIDVTNGGIYTEQVRVLCDTWLAMRREGNATPQITFLAHSHEGRVARQLRDTFYASQRLAPLWFLWKGKPLLLANPSHLNEGLRDFFTLRESWAWSRTKWFGNGHAKWPWIDDSPQKPGWWHRGVPEQAPVSAAGHPTRNLGRSHSKGTQPPPSETRPDAAVYFREQFAIARAIDPEFIFVTGWNEWVAQRFVHGVSKDQSTHLLGKQLEKGDTYFVDQYNQEFSRDIEPMRGGHGDRYYRQLVAEVRRYKGVPALPRGNGPHRIRVDGNTADWESVTPEYRDTIGDTAKRDHPGWGAAGQLTEDSGRNDLVSMRVAYDREQVFFMAETLAPLSTGSGAWMVLLVDSDRRLDTGWHGYDLMVRPSPHPSGQAEILLYTGETERPWRKVGHGISACAGRQLEVAVPRPILQSAASLAFDFHWYDAHVELDRVEDLLERGDSAPNRSFNYQYVAARPLKSGDR